MGRTFNKHEAVLYTRHRNLADPAQLSILEACLCPSPPNESNPRLLFRIANATQCRGYILKRALPDNSLGISSARILARLSSRRGKDRWVGALDWSAGLVEKKKKNLFPDFTLALFHTVSGNNAAPWFYYTPPSSILLGGGARPWNGLRFCFWFWFRSLLEGGRGIGLLLRTPFHFFDTVFSFGKSVVVMVEVQRFLECYIQDKLWVKYSVMGRAILCGKE